MKKLLIMLFTHLSTLTIAIGASAQTDFTSANERRPDFTAPAETYGKEPKIKMDIKTSAIRNFRKQFPEVRGEAWSKTNYGYLVGFTTNKVQTSVFLSQNGTCLGSIRSYTEKELPAEVRHQVKSTYYDFSIFTVAEVTSAGQTAYLITLEDKTSWKVIRIADGEMRIWKEYQKADKDNQ
jgi:hypothetical protein